MLCMQQGLIKCLVCTFLYIWTSQDSLDLEFLCGASCTLAHTKCDRGQPDSQVPWQLEAQSGSCSHLKTSCPLPLLFGSFEILYFSSYPFPSLPVELFFSFLGSLLGPILVSPLNPSSSSLSLATTYVVFLRCPILVSYLESIYFSFKTSVTLLLSWSLMFLGSPDLNAKCSLVNEASSSQMVVSRLHTLYLSNAI